MLKDFQDIFILGNRDISCHALELLNGLFLAPRGERNLERIVEHTHDQVSEAHYQRLQHFITDSPWDSQALMSSVAKQVIGLFENWQDTAYIIDEKAHLKKGKQSVGVANQYAGTVGKNENCQVGVYATLANGPQACLINCRLFLPKLWTDDKKRCKKAGIPTDKIKYYTKQQLALAMIKEDIAQGLQFGWVGGDALYGHGYELSHEIEALGKDFVFDVHEDQRIYLQKPMLSLPEKRKTGRPYTRLQSNTTPMEVRQYVAQLTKKDFQQTTIRKTTKGYLKALIHVVKVWTWIAPSHREKGQLEPKERTLIIRKSLSKKSKEKIKYSLTNIPIEKATPERFAFMQAQRYWIEKTFRDDSQDLGMSDYQIRKYNSWYHFQALTMLGMLFVLKEKIRNKDTIPLLSYRDVKVIIQVLFTNNLPKLKLTIEQMIHRHMQRQKDIDRNYASALVT